MLIKSRHDEDYNGPLHIFYSIRRTESTDKPWLGIDGWQESRHTFELSAFGIADLSSAGNLMGNLMERKKPLFSPALLMASSAVLIACAVTAPFVLGGLDHDSVKKTSAEKEMQKYAVAVREAQITAVDKLNDNAINDDKEGPAKKVKAAIQLHTGKRMLHGKSYTYWKNYDNAPAVPCTPDMIDKGITCE